MRKKTIMVAVLLLLFATVNGFSRGADDSGRRMPGLVGFICENPRFREPASQDIIKHVNHNWTGGPWDWSGYWQGCIEGPFTGEVTFPAEAGMFRLSFGVGGRIEKDMSVAEKAESLERISFRTGEYRKLGLGKGRKSGDLAKAGEPVEEAVYYVNNVSIAPWE